MAGPAGLQPQLCSRPAQTCSCSQLGSSRSEEHCCTAPSPASPTLGSPAVCLISLHSLVHRRHCLAHLDCGEAASGECARESGLDGGFVKPLCKLLHSFVS